MKYLQRFIQPGNGHEGCKYFVVPKTRTNWWLNKINRNKELDIKNQKELIR